MPKKIIDGVLITTFSDQGPIPIYNTSTLTELISIKLSVVGMTILSLGFGGEGIYEKRHFRLHGPIPVPDTTDLEALAMSFKVSTNDSIDSRVSNYGRESTVFILFFSEYRKELITMHDKVESVLKNVLTNFKSDLDLENTAYLALVTDKINKLFEEELVPPPDAQQKPSIGPNTVVQPETSIPPKNHGVILYTLNSEGTLTLLDEYTKINTADILVFVNTYTKTIFNLSLKQNISQQKRFFAAKAISQLNLNEYKSEYQTRTITDDFEVSFYLEKIQSIYDQYGLN